MKFHAVYTTHREGRGKRIDSDSLYCSCHDIAGVTGGIVMRTATRNGLVAFWDPDRAIVRPGFAATPREREAIENYRLSAD